MFKGLTAAVLSFCLVSGAVAGVSGGNSESLTLHHRYLSSDPSTPFTILGTLEAGSNNLALSSATHATDVVEKDSNAWYQIAVAPTGEKDISQWPKASTRACFAESGETIHVTLNYPTGSSVPDALNVKIDGTPRNGSCGSLGRPRALPTGPFNIISKSPVRIQGPDLAPPIAVDPATGAVAQEAEKTFFQKYWMYLLGAGLIASTLFGDEPQAKK